MSDQSFIIDIPKANPVKVRALELAEGHAKYLDALGRWLPLDCLSTHWHSERSSESRLTLDGLLAYRIGKEGPVLGPEEGYSLHLASDRKGNFHGSLTSPALDMVAYHSATSTSWHYTVNAGTVGEVEPAPLLYLAGPWFFGSVFAAGPQAAIDFKVLHGPRSRLSPLAAPRLQLA